MSLNNAIHKLAPSNSLQRLVQSVRLSASQKLRLFGVPLSSGLHASLPDPLIDYGGSGQRTSSMPNYTNT